MLEITCVGVFSTRMWRMRTSDCWLAEKTDICAHLKVRIVRHMVSSCDLLTKANWDPKVITQVSTVAIQPQKETLLGLAHRSCLAKFRVR